MGRQTNRTRRAAQAESARARAARLREEAAQQQRRRRRLITGATVLVVAAVATVIALVATGSSNQPSQTANLTKAIRLAASAGTGSPPWPRPTDTIARAQQAGLFVGGSEGTAVHFHAHLDLLINGKSQPVPAGLGLTSTQDSELHTHDASGVIHVEAPGQGQWFLGQVFDEWNVRLTSTQIGGLAANATDNLRAYVDGKLYTGNPAAIKLAAHQEIALVYGPRSANPHVPSSYQFPAGE